MFEAEAEQVLGYQFREPKLLAEALRHSSSADSRLDSNERQEFLGDAVLGLVVSEYLFQQFPTYQEGELTKIKSAVVSRKVCAKISQQVGLSELLTLGKGMSSRTGVPASVAAGVVESIIAAIYLDGGMEPARAFILKHFGPYIRELSSSSHQQNFKSVLQQYAQRHLPANPLYVLLDEKGPDHSKCFEVCVEINGRRFPSSWAPTKKEAEQGAALQALRELELVKEDEGGRIVVVERERREEAGKGEK